MAENLTIMFMPESAYGPTNQCIGLGDVLRRRGHSIVFASERSWAGKLEPFGFTEALVDLAPPEVADDAAAGADAASDTTAGNDAAGQFWIDFINDTAPEFRKPTIDQLASFVQPTYQALIDGARYVEPQLKNIIETHRPDVIVEDNVVTFPALITSGAPFVRIVSCNPLEIRGPEIPPVFSGYSADDRGGWEAFLDRFDETHQAMWQEFNEWVVEQGAPPLPPRDFMHTSPAANLYVYPEEIDYTDRRPLGDRWHRMDSSVRQTDDGFTLPDGWATRDHAARRTNEDAVIYLSLGSLGGADIGLLQRLIDVLATTRYKVVVSMGPRARELRLADTMIGSEFLPQTNVIPQVDLVITHGGNNTVTEALHFGKPMIVLPLFWDQYDNAQRIDETGFGKRLATYTFADSELIEAVDGLVADEGVCRRAEATGRAIRARDGLTHGADVIERVGRTFPSARRG